MNLIYEEIKRFLGQFQDISIRGNHSERRYELEKSTQHIEEQFLSRDARITSLLEHNNELLDRARSSERVTQGKQISINSLEVVLADYANKLIEINKQAKFLETLMPTTTTDASAVINEIIILSEPKE